MTEKKYTPIPRRQKCVNKEHPYVAGAEDIIDDELGKPQNQVNKEANTNLNLEKSRAQNAEQGLDSRLGVVEELAEISVGGGDVGIANQEDFENPTLEQKAKIPTVGAIYDSGIISRAIELDAPSGVDLKPNILYDLGIRTSLTITFAEGLDGLLNEYMFQFRVSGDNFELQLPNGIEWMEEPEFSNGYTYQVSIVNNLAICAGWEGEPITPEPESSESEEAENIEE